MAEKVKLRRQLSLVHGVAVICGLVIGSGIYVTPKATLSGTGSAGMSLVLWAAGGVVATFGALTFAELGTTFPSGGEKYHYLEKTFGPFVAFMYLWMYLMMFRPGANAIKCLTFAKYILEPIYECDVPDSAVIIIAVLLAGVLTALNCWNVRWAVHGQSIFTSIGILALVIVAITGIVHLALGNTENLVNSFEGTSTDLGDIFIASYAATFSYWGWSALNFMVEELKDPYKNLPRAIWISMAIVTCLYVTVNTSYLAVLGVDGVLKSEAVAVTFAQKTLGVMSWIMPICIAINTAGSFNSGSLVGSRLCFAGARRGHLPDVLALIHVKYMSPVTALIFQLVAVIIMASTVDIYTLLNNLVFMNCLFDTLNIVGMLWQKYKRPDLPRPIKVHIIFPIIYLLCMVSLMLIPLIIKPANTMYALIGFVIVVATGIPYYLLFVTWENKPRAYRMWVKTQTERVQKIVLCVKEEPEF